MSYKEIWSSQKINIDEDGSTFVRNFLCDWADWNNGTFPYRVGQKLSADIWLYPDGIWFPKTEWTESLLVRDIDARPTTNPLVLSVDVSYSSKTSSASTRPDQIRSWECSGGVSMEDREPGSYLGADGTVRTFEEYWKTTDYAIAHPEAAVPEIRWFKPTHEMTFTLYGKSMYIYRLKAAIGTLNIDDFLFTLLHDFSEGTETKVKPDPETHKSDAGKWLFADMRYNRIRVDCWRYDLTFKELRSYPPASDSSYNKYTWNQPYGDKIKIGSNPFNLYMYHYSNFISLFEGMYNTDPEELQGGGTES